jgi:hypothetical protein
VRWRINWSMPWRAWSAIPRGFNQFAIGSELLM